MHPKFHFFSCRENVTEITLRPSGSVESFASRSYFYTSVTLETSKFGLKIAICLASNKGQGERALVCKSNMAVKPSGSTRERNNLRRYTSAAPSLCGSRRSSSQSVSHSRSNHDVTEIRSPCGPSRNNSVLDTWPALPDFNPIRADRRTLLGEKPA